MEIEIGIELAISYPIALRISLYNSNLFRLGFDGRLHNHIIFL
jgi:hypothetical protein